MSKYVAFLRGINVGGNHKVPMAELCKEMESLGLENVITILNTGNIIFDAHSDDIEKLEKTISEHLEKTFGFSIPTILRSGKVIEQLLKRNPFKDIEVTKDIRLYVSLLKKEEETDLQLPWTSKDKSYSVLEKKDKIIASVLDVSINKTTKAMLMLEKEFGKGITTRNWNTLQRIDGKLI